MYTTVKQEVSKNLIRSFLMQIMIYTIVVLFASLVGYLFCSDRIWYFNDPLYPFIHFLHVEWFGIFWFCLLVGCVVITLIHFFRIARMMELITQAVSGIAAGNAPYIVLPAPLQVVENQLNAILWNMKTEQNKTREAEQRKNDMIVYMAHDLKTPLTSVIGYLTLLTEEKQIEEQIRAKYLGIALKKAQRLEDLINDFFEVTRYNLSHMTLVYSNINLTMMLEQMLYEFAPIFAEKDVTYRTNMAEGLMLRCDAEKMERVFDNLFKNALNYCYPNTEIVVGAWQDGSGGILITVENAGKTIPEEQREHLFEQFFRVDSSRNSQTGGSGLGLAIAKEIVTLHGGAITCQSADERIVFTLRLPLAG